jgi:ADP-heptose:LPS heptosyltransferase
MVINRTVLFFFFISVPYTQSYTAQNNLASCNNCFEEKEVAPSQKQHNSLALYADILKQSPFNFHAVLNAAKILRSQTKYDQALYLLSKATDNLPEKNDDLLALGNALLQLGNNYFDEHMPQKAITAFKKILSISESLNAVHHNIAFTLSEQEGAYGQSLEHYRKALKVQPNNSETHFCYALSLLATGNLLDGFKEYEWRWKRGNNAPRQFHYPLPFLWQGTEPLEGKRILLRVEQGIGDTLMFIRYAQLLKQQGAIVIAETQKPIVQLLSACPYLDTVLPIGSPLPPYDYQIPILNLAMAFKTTQDTIPAQVPYLYPDQQLVASWRKKMAQDKLFKIGICWRGDAAHGAHKFMPISYFTRLATIHGVSLYSLQKNDPLSTIKPAQQADGTCIIQFEEDFDESHGRFMDTAAVMKNLDLIITVDTSIAHLAGGLGIPTWVILPFPAEWRWLEERSDSPWYPTMKLFRQKKYDNWQSVYEELEISLRKLVQ